MVGLLLTGCYRSPLNCRSEYLYPDYLASEQILTPDPCRSCFCGQQVVVNWKLARQCLPAILLLHVRYGTRKQETFCWSITSTRDYRLYRLINQEYWSKKGIVSYKAELYYQEELLADWEHSLWVDVIELM